MSNLPRDVGIEAVHGWFGLSYANYLVLPRTLMQSMPDDWQARMVACLTEMHAAFRHVQHADTYKVDAAEFRDVCELSEQERVWLGYSCDESDGVTANYYDPAGDEIEPWEQVPVPTADPVPHYSRGRTYIAPMPPEGHVLARRVSGQWAGVCNGPTAFVPAADVATHPDEWVIVPTVSEGM